MLEGFGSVPGAELRDKNRSHLGKPGMKLNSRALAKLCQRTTCQCPEMPSSC